MPLQQVRRLGFCKQSAPWPDAVLGPGHFAKIHSSARAARRNSEAIRMAYVPAHLLDPAAKCWNRVQGDAGVVLRHSSFRSTLDVYTQAVTPAKHAAQAAVMSLVFSSDKDGAVLVAG